MTSNFEKVAEFQKAVGAKRPFSPTHPEKELLSLWLGLIREEYEEMLEAADPLLEETADLASLANFAHELADLLYVTYGAFTVCGINADAVFGEIHRANMAKMGGPRRADGKLLKPPGWQPANVLKLLEKMGENE